MIYPSVVNVVATSIVVRPVTHTALVAVKRALKNEIPPTVARGSSSNPVPHKIMNKKLPTMIQLGDKRFESECVTTADSFSIASIATMPIIM
jgi:hypothetical protein